MKLKHLALVAVTLFALKAAAVDFRFDFSVYSSGVDMYACDAGLIHFDKGPRICVYEDDPTRACDLSKDHNCKCSGTNGGAYLKDFMRYNAAKWVGRDWTSSVSGAVSATEDQAEFYKNTVTQQLGTQKLATRLNELTFNLGSELYGARFFLDICFRGSQIEYFNNDRLIVNTSNALLAEFGVTDVEKPSSTSTEVTPGGVPATYTEYVTRSGLKARVKVICDVQGKGTQRLAMNEQSRYDTLNTDLYLLDLDNPNWGRTRSLVSGGSSLNDFATVSNGDSSGAQWRSILTSGTNNMVATEINQNSPYHPRFCVIRYEFSESNRAFRQWLRNDAKIKTTTRIEEALNGGN